MTELHFHTQNGEKMHMLAQWTVWSRVKFPSRCWRNIITYSGKWWHVNLKKKEKKREHSELAEWNHHCQRGTASMTSNAFLCVCMCVCVCVCVCGVEESNVWRNLTTRKMEKAEAELVMFLVACAIRLLWRRIKDGAESRERTRLRRGFTYPV